MMLIIELVEVQITGNLSGYPVDYAVEPDQLVRHP